MTFAFEYTRSLVLEHSVENEVVFADFNGCAFQVGSLSCGELLVSELHSALAVVVIATDDVGKCKGDYIYRVVFEYGGCIIRCVWHNANHTIGVGNHLILYVIPMNGVVQLGYVADLVHRLFFEHFTARAVAIGSVEFHIVGKFHRIGIDGAEATEINRAAPAHCDVGIDELLAAAFLVEERGVHQTRILEIVESVGIFNAAHRAGVGESNHRRHRTSVVVVDVVLANNRSVGAGIHAHHIDACGVDFVGNFMRQHKSGAGDAFALVNGRKFLHGSLHVLNGILVVLVWLHYLEVVGEVDSLVSLAAHRRGFPTNHWILQLHQFGSALHQLCLRLRLEEGRSGIGGWAAACRQAHKGGFRFAAVAEQHLFQLVLRAYKLHFNLHEIHLVVVAFFKQPAWNIATRLRHIAPVMLRLKFVESILHTFQRMRIFGSGCHNLHVVGYTHAFGHPAFVNRIWRPRYCRRLHIESLNLVANLTVDFGDRFWRGELRWSDNRFRHSEQ